MRTVDLENQLLHYAHLLVNCPVLARELVYRCESFSEEEKEPVLSNRVAELFLAVKQECLSTIGAGNLSNGEIQLELFAENELVGADAKEELKSVHLSARARVFIGSLQEEERRNLFLGSDSSKNLWATTLEAFFMQLSREHENGYSRIALKEKSEALPRVISYLISVGGDEAGLEVERKCREHPDWQRIKVQVGIALELLENAILSWGKVDELYHSKEEMDESENADHVPSDNFSAETDHRNVKERQNRPERYQLWKIYFYTGLAASLIAYFGWLESSNSKSPSPLPATSIPELKGTGNTENLMIEEVEDLVAELAQKKANDLLAERLVLQIAELDQSLNVPESSFLPGTYTEEGVTEESKEGDIDQNEVLIRELLEIDEGAVAQLFFPQGEALGKVRIEKVKQNEILFRRVDWQNPQRSYAISQRSYEVRYRHPEHGEVIFSGYVRRGEEGSGPLRLYILSLEEAWRLTAEQKRIPVSPSFRTGSEPER